MDLPFELHIALRYLLAKRKQAFISVISLISTLGVTVGVMALVIALALMTGLQDRKSTRLNSSHRTISYAVFCLKKKKKNKETAVSAHRHSSSLYSTSSALAMYCVC